jgi:ABC-type dipeptide/oligopeptide/nickel transport system permease subunit
MRGSSVPFQRSTRTLLGVGVALLVLVIGAAVLADVLAAHPPNRSSGPPYARPSSAHWLGTDDLGRDLFAQLLHGARVSLAVGLIAATLATLLGTAVGLVAGWVGGWVDALAMRLVDLTLALPFLVLVLVLAAYFGRGLETLTLLIAGVLWARPARLLRSQVLKVSRFGHVRAAQVMGASVTRILLRHVLPRMVPLLTSVFVRAAAVAVIVQAGVAFLGLGDPNRISWGGCRDRRVGVRGLCLGGACRAPTGEPRLAASGPSPAAGRPRTPRPDGHDPGRPWPDGPLWHRHRRRAGVHRSPSRAGAGDRR